MTDSPSRQVGRLPTAFPSHAPWPARLRWLLQAVLGREDGRLAGSLVRGTTGTAGLRIAGIGLAFLTSVVLARLLGPAGYGAFAFAIALLHLLSIPASLGMHNLIIRNVARYSAQGRAALTAGLLRRANQLVLAASLLVAAAAFGVSLLLGGAPPSLMTRAFWMALPAVPLLVLLRTQQAALQGLNRVVTGQLPEAVVLPALLLAMILGWWRLAGPALDARVAVALNSLAAGLSLACAVVLLRRFLPSGVRDARPEYRVREWLRSALPLLLLTGLYVVNSRTDVIMLGAIRDAESVGVYNVAARGAEFVVFFLTVVDRAMGPTVARLYAAGGDERLQGIVTSAARLVLLLSVPVAGILMGFGDRILAWVYGPAFAEGHAALAILSGAQLAGVAMGSVALILIMTGHEKEAAMGVGLSAVANVVLNAALIPPFGVVGAAWATGLSLVLWNAIFAAVTYRRTGLNPTAFRRNPAPRGGRR